MRFIRVLNLLLVVLAVTAIRAEAVNYDIIAVKAPRYGDNVMTHWQEVFNEDSIEPNQSLILLHPDGSEELLVDCTPTTSGTPRNCSVVDPFISFDGQEVYYSFYPDASSSGYNSQRGIPYQGADIYRMNLATRQAVRLTNQEFTPNTGVVNWSSSPLGGGANTYKLGYGILNLGACPITGPDGSEWIAFTSNRNAFLPPRGYANVSMQLFIMDHDGKNVQQIGFLNLGSALHPTQLKDGRIAFSTLESQGNRDGRLWGLWAIWPDGRKWEPLMSAFTDAQAFHFASQMSDGHIAVTNYYNLNNNGFGIIMGFLPQGPAGLPPFGGPNANDASNPDVREGRWRLGATHPNNLAPRYRKYPFSPPGLINYTAYSEHDDNASPPSLTLNYAGKATHPSGAPNNDLLFIHSPGPANKLTRPENTPAMLGQIALLPGGVPVDDPNALVILKSDVNFNYQQPRAAVPYSAVYGVASPTKLSFLPQSSTPYGVVGTASFYNRDTKPGYGVATYDGLDPFNTTENGASSNWVQQGADDGKYSNSDIYAVRIVSMEPTSHLSYGPDGYEHTRAGFRSTANERLRILGEIPLRKAAGVLDGDGNPDTSFLARIPADVPFTFQTLDKDGLVLNMAQTWHQIRPGEDRHDCGGCHAHAHMATDFTKTAAAQPGYNPYDLAHDLMLLSKDSQGNPTLKTFSGAARKQMMDVEYERDIRPIFARSCDGCHSGNNPAAGLDTTDTLPTNSKFGRGFLCLTNDQSSTQCNVAKSVLGSFGYARENLSRYVRSFQSRRSLLTWKVFGRRLDGWTNANHPTESVLGDPTTLPSGANKNDVDIDYVGEIMPPPSSNFPALTEDEKMTIARWIDLGAPGMRVDGAEAFAGWFTDETRPTLHISWPPPQRVGSLDYLQFVSQDHYSGLNTSTLKVTADFVMDGIPAGQDIASHFSVVSDGVWQMNLAHSINLLARGTLTVEILDNAGNKSKQAVTFTVDPSAPVLPTPTTIPSATPTKTPTPTTTNAPPLSLTPTAVSTSDPTNGSQTPNPEATNTPSVGVTPGVTRTPTARPTPNEPSSTDRLPKIAKSKNLKFKLMRISRAKFSATNMDRSLGPVRFWGEGLPRGLKIDLNGALHGKPRKVGVFKVKLFATNKFGTSKPRSVRIVVKR